FAIKKDGHRYEIDISELPVNDPIMDIGLQTVAKYSDMLKEAKAIILNGPMGVYELEEFSIGTEEIFRTIANINCFKVAGGGHTISMISKLELNKKFTHVSVGGGALINFLSGESMPGLEALKLSKNKFQGMMK
ncbi:MAG: phosphoglycerate kinase, partial [Thermoplasmata archaeon]